MEKYILNLLADINEATVNINWPWVQKDTYNIWEVLPDVEEERVAPIRQLEEWTGITKEMLPPVEFMNDHQVHLLLESLKKMLDALNCCFVLQFKVPERIQYATIRDNFNQEVKLKQWNPGFFQLCRPGTDHGKCALNEFCHCAFFKEFFKDMIDEKLTPEEERQRMFDIELQQIKKKYGADWMKFYPYHLNPEYDDEFGNPYNYGFGEDDFDDDEIEDDWWRV